MSTDSTNPNDPAPVEPTGPPTTEAATTGPATDGPATDGPATDGPGRTDPSADDAAPAGARRPGRTERNTPLLITILLAVIVAAVAVGALSYYRATIDDRNADTAAAFVRTVTAQGATVDTVECNGHTCAAIIGNQAYTVLVQEDAQGQQHFGVSAYVGP